MSPTSTTSFSITHPFLIQNWSSTPLRMEVPIYLNFWFLVLFLCHAIFGQCINFELCTVVVLCVCVCVFVCVCVCVCVCVYVCASVHGSTNLLVTQLRDKLVILTGSVSCSLQNHFGVFRIIASFRR